MFIFENEIKMISVKALFMLNHTALLFKTLSESLLRFLNMFHNQDFVECGNTMTMDKRFVSFK